MDHFDFMAKYFEQQGQRFCRINIVVNDQNAARLGRLRCLGSKTLRRKGGRFAHQGKSNDEFGPPAQTIARRRDAAAVLFNKVLNQGKTDSQPAYPPFKRSIRLNEDIENVRELCRVDTDARVADPYDRLIFMILDGDVNASTLIRELATVV